jgi:hypothetical protein
MATVDNGRTDAQIAEYFVRCDHQKVVKGERRSTKSVLVIYFAASTPRPNHPHMSLIAHKVPDLSG